MWEENPKPVEETDPIFAEHMRKIANGEHPAVKAINMGVGHAEVYMNDRSIRRYQFVGRNDPCSCGSGIKYKNCGRWDTWLLNPNDANKLKDLLVKYAKKKEDEAERQASAIL